MQENNKPPLGDEPAHSVAGSEGSAVAIIYTTWPDVDAATKVGREIIEGGIAGCVNILPAMTSIYGWEGKIETANECVMILKLARAGVQRAVDFIKERHTYETPAILVLPVSGGSSGYLHWLAAGTRTI